MSRSEILGLDVFIKKCLNANGPAQIVSYAFWGVLIAGMFWDFCDKCVPNELLAAWGALSVVVLIMAIYAPKHFLEIALILDMVVSMVVMMMIIMHEPHTAVISYTVALDGSILDKVVMDSHVSEWFHTFALVWMVLHSLYLANLTHRQILERTRFTQ